MNKQTLENFKKYFSQVDVNNNSLLTDIYSDNVVFTDPIHQIQGIKKLIQYFNKLNENLIEGSFFFTDVSINDDKAYLCWDMTLKLKKPKKIINATGFSVLTFKEGKIIKQRDFFDVGELFYENIPILGSIVRYIKKKIAADIE